MNTNLSTEVTYQLIQTDQQLNAFYEENKDVEWLAFDTEFVGEKRYQTRLCLIQAATVHGYYLIDPFGIRALGDFLRLLEDPAIAVITHAGDNDYRLLNALYGLVPANVWDTQLAAGLLGYRYPSSLSKLVEQELDIHIKKGYAVTDWEERPMSKKQLEYAIEDVQLLRPLWLSLHAKLEKAGRLHWVQEECSRMERPAYYLRDPNQEALTSNLIRSLKPREQIFLIRLYDWRRRLAEEKDYSREMILSSKLISHVVKTVRSGKDALLENRRVPASIVNRHGKEWEQLYQQPATAAEKALLLQIANDDNEDERDEILIEFIYLLMKYRCMEEGISHSLVMPRNAIKRMKNDPAVREDLLGNGWRRQLLGDDFERWIAHFDELKLSITGGNITIEFH
jgi:ribonuclease D